MKHTYEFEKDGEKFQIPALAAEKLVLSFGESNTASKNPPGRA